LGAKERKIEGPNETTADPIVKKKKKKERGRDGKRLSKGALHILGRRVPATKEKGGRGEKKSTRASRETRREEKKGTGKRVAVGS